jgi:hypothetical protein
LASALADVVVTFLQTLKAEGEAIQQFVDLLKLGSVTAIPKICPNWPNKKASLPSI